MSSLFADPIHSAAIVVGDVTDRSTWRLASEWVWPHPDRLGRLVGRPRIVSIDQSRAFAFVRDFHRHHDAPQGWRWGLGLVRDAEWGGGSVGPVLVGVGIAGRPVAQALDDGSAIEFTRCCVWITRNAASMIYGALIRQARERGFGKAITYTLPTESGASLRAVGFTPVATTAGGSWNRRGRRRTDKGPTCPKIRWEKPL